MWEKLKRPDFYLLVLLYTLLGSALTLIAMTIWFSVTHTCVESKVMTCTTPICTAYNSKGMCMVYTYHEYPCSTCTKWEKK